ncbi:MAG: CsgG/HfaB family protein [Fibrobacterota bacterium]|nr:CsgG/HfaB family protein [Fibrobacterota bacterium]
MESRAAPAQADSLSRGASPSCPVPKRRIAIILLKDESGFAANAFGKVNDLGRQAGDLLALHLGKSGEFIVLHGRDRVPPQAAYALISGSVVELDARIDSSEAGEYPAGIRKAHAKVAINMVDPVNGAILFSDSDEADTRKAPLPDTASGALEVAIVKLAARLAATLRSRPWRARILEVSQGKVVIGAGTRAGIMPGQELRIVRPGRQVKEPTSGVILELPGEEVGRIKVVSQFGTGEWDEGSECTILSGKGFARTDYVSLEEGL